MVFEYFLVLLCFLICCLIAFLMVFISYSIIYQEVDYEKISAYECGFQPFDDARSKFDIKFYLVAILFIIFDLEVMFLFPWSICIFEITIFGHLTMFFFLFILTIGFIYEWRKGALDWN